jgi:FlaG/FlaF family flagellin (archaellin)
MHHTTHLRSRRFFVAVAVTLAALLMVGVSTAVKSAHSATPQTQAAAATTATNHAFSGFHDGGIACPRAWATS